METKHSKEKVAVVKYDGTFDSFEKALEVCGGLNGLKTNDKVLIKPNIFWGGAQAAWWGPMAIAVIAGLSFATFLTLILLPVMHSLLDDMVSFLRRHFRANGQAALRADEMAESTVV